MLTVETHRIVLLCLQGFSVNDGVHATEICHRARVKYAICKKAIIEKDIHAKLKDMLANVSSHLKYNFIYSSILCTQCCGYPMRSILLVSEQCLVSVICLQHGRQSSNALCMCMYWTPCWLLTENCHQMVQISVSQPYTCHAPHKRFKYLPTP